MVRSEAGKRSRETAGIEAGKVDGFMARKSSQKVGVGQKQAF